MYMLFMYSKYYPSGGWNDHYGDFDTIEEAKEVVIENESYMDYYQIVSVNDQRIVESGSIQEL